MNTKWSTARVYSIAWLGFVMMASPALAQLQVTFAVGTAVEQIVDNDVDDNNPALQIIDFDLPNFGGFLAKGRVVEGGEDIDRVISITSTTPPDAYGIFHNISGSAATLTVTVDSNAFTLRGPPLGWAVYYKAYVDDPAPNAVSVSSSLDVYTDVNELLVTVPGPIINLALSPPPPPDATLVDVQDFGSHNTQDAQTARVVFTFNAGPGDRISLIDNNDVNHKGIEVHVFNQDAKCVDAMNNRARQLINKAVKDDAVQCVRLIGQQGGGDATPCIDHWFEFRTDKKESALLTNFDQRCNPVPSWGVNGGSCCESNSVAIDGGTCTDDADCAPDLCRGGACISYAVETAVNAVMHDLFGASAIVSNLPNESNCQSRTVKATGKVLETRAKSYRQCVKRNFTAIHGSVDQNAALTTTCLGPPQPDQPDSINGKIAKKENKLTKFLERCVADGVTPGTLFAGECAGAINPNAIPGDGDFAECLEARIACRFCLMVNTVSAVTPPLDCDLYDDMNTGNGSCP